ncbi:MAG: glucose 1-dehydrogenase [Reinekea sp.]
MACTLRRYGVTDSGSIYFFKNRRCPHRFIEIFAQLVGILIKTTLTEIQSFNNRKKVFSMTQTEQDSCFTLQGKVALITGASRGIGEAIARLYARNGASVIISSRSQEALETVAADINKDFDCVTPIACHIGNTEDAEQLIATITKQFGKIDILVNNAATNPYFGEMLDTPDSMIEKTIDVNIKGYLKMCQLVGKVMMDNGGGSIINTASVNGITPAPMQGIYSVTKAAVISMTAALAKENARYGIRVNAVLPGLTDTKFASALTKNEAMLKNILPMIPMRRMAQPEEIAPAFLFLASDASSYITGVNLPVDGGLLC